MKRFGVVDTSRTGEQSGVGVARVPLGLISTPARRKQSRSADEPPVDNATELIAPTSEAAVEVRRHEDTSRSRSSGLNLCILGPSATTGRRPARTMARKALTETPRRAAAARAVSIGDARRAQRYGGNRCTSARNCAGRLSREAIGGSRRCLCGASIAIQARPASKPRSARVLRPTWHACRCARAPARSLRDGATPDTCY